MKIQDFSDINVIPQSVCISSLKTLSGFAIIFSWLKDADIARKYIEDFVK